MSKNFDIFLFNSCSESTICKHAYEVLLEKLDKVKTEVGKHTEAFSKGEVNIVVTDSKTMRGLNKNFRGIDASTDVLSFPMDAPLIGEIWIDPNIVQQNASKFKEMLDIETIRVVVHGLLHLADFDHKKSFTRGSISAEKMYQVQEEIISGIFKA